MAARTRCAWSKDEEDALRRAVAVHGVGNWASILSDPAFVGVFAPSRTNVDVKDKWRNLERKSAAATSDDTKEATTKRQKLTQRIRCVCPPGSGKPCMCRAFRTVDVCACGKRHGAQVACLRASPAPTTWSSPAPHPTAPAPRWQLDRAEAHEFDREINYPVLRWTRPKGCTVTICDWCERCEWCSRSPEEHFTCAGCERTFCYRCAKPHLPEAYDCADSERKFCGLCTVRDESSATGGGDFGCDEVKPEV